MGCSYCCGRNNAYIWSGGRHFSLLGRKSYSFCLSLEKNKRYSTIIIAHALLGYVHTNVWYWEIFLYRYAWIRITLTLDPIIISCNMIGSQHAIMYMHQGMILFIIIAINILIKYAFIAMSKTQCLIQYHQSKYMLSSSLEESGLSPA